jgi:chromosome segregation ATPase
MIYTAAEMRDKSEQMAAMAKGMRATNSYNPGVIADYETAAAMLRQAAEAMDTFDGVRDAMADEIQALRDEAEITPAKD